MQKIPTGNSHTPVAYDGDWLVLDLGSGHGPHLRADVLVDRSLSEDKHRGGRGSDLSSGKPFVLADGRALPFADSTFDFVICSHVVEHVVEIDAFMREMNRVTRAGYLETPSKLAEVIRPRQFHYWYVSARNGQLRFERTPGGYPLGSIGKLFYSLYFYKTVHTGDSDVYAFARGIRPPFGYALTLLRMLLTRGWLLLKPLTYTRILWSGNLPWTVREDGGQG
jgi:SAM-dependent methyltransferase